MYKRQARAQESVSLHVTIGINQLTWRGLVERTVQQVVDKLPEEHLPGGFLEDRGALADELARRLEQVADDVRRLDASAAVEAEVRRFLTGRGSRLDGGLRDVLEVSGIGDSTLLRRRPGHPCVLLPHGDRLEVLLGDRSLEVPARLEPALEEIRARTELRPADLHDHLDPQSCLVLCRRLVREGLLGVVR